LLRAELLETEKIKRGGDGREEGYWGSLKRIKSIEG